MFKLLASKSWFAFATQYVIKNGSFLIQAPPKRPLSGYNLFIQKSFESNKNVKSASAEVTNFSKVWTESPELQKSYALQGEKLSSDYKKQKQDYEQKYGVPFTPVSHITLGIQKVFKDKTVVHVKGQTVQEFGKRSQAARKSLPEDEVNKLKAESIKIREQRQKLQKQFKFPQNEYKNFRIYSTRHYVELAKRTPTYEAQMKAAYEKHEAEWKQSVANWLKTNNYDITLEEFLVLYKKTAKKTVKKTKAEVIDFEKVENQNRKKDTVSIDELQRFVELQSLFSNLSAKKPTNDNAPPKTNAHKATRSASKSPKPKAKKAQQK